jgi:hypothetical protein
MAGKARVIAGPRNTSFDHYVEDVLARGGWGQEQDYFGIEDIDRADFIRRKLRMAGQHMDPPVAVKAYWHECAGCNNGGPRCRYHVKFTIYDMAKAREFKTRLRETVERQR